MIMQFLLLYKRQLIITKRAYVSISFSTRTYSTLSVVLFQGWVVNRLLAHIFIGFLFGYLYRDVGRGANTILANYIYLYGTLLLVVYTGKMPVTLCCKYYFENFKFNYRICFKHIINYNVYSILGH